MIGRLPTTLEVHGVERKIRTDFRDVLVIMEAFGDPDLAAWEKNEVMLTVLYEDRDIPDEDLPEALEKALWFLDCGQVEEDKKPTHRVMDWGQDEPILFPAINKVAGREVRAVDHMHWWTFMGCYMEIADGTFSMVLGIRQKLAKGKKLEDWEQEFYRGNKRLCDLKKRCTAAEQSEMESLNSIFR